ncbi:MAG: TIGR02281 family clan AA aspartic protease [Geminicoccaceae bacterium]
MTRWFIAGVVLLGAAYLIDQDPELRARLIEQTAAVADHAAAELKRSANEPKTTSRTTASGWNQIRIPGSAYGQHMVDVSIEGRSIRFLVDTGASFLVLSPEDARAIGLRPMPSDYTVKFRTANGFVRAAPVTLRDVRLGQFETYNVEAFVNEVPIGTSLLGMNFLQRFERFEIRDGDLTLYW